MDQIGGVDEVNALSFGLGQEFGKGAQRFRVRMADGNGFVFFARLFEGKLNLAANGGDLLNIIEKRHISESAGHTGGLGAIVGDGSGGGAAVNKEKMVGAEKGHKFGHEARIGSGERTLMIVDTNRRGHAFEHGVQDRRDFRGRHARAKLLGFRDFVGERFHREMKHDLISAATGLLGNLRGVGMIREDGEGQGIAKRENSIDGGGVGGDVVKDDCQARTGDGRRGRT